MKKGFISSILTLALCLLVGTAAAQTYPDTLSQTVTETTTGTGTWTAPVGAWKITKLEAWGGGGGGGNATYSSSSARAGSGGGGGAYVAYENAISVVLGDTVSYSVASSVSNATDGKPSTITFGSVSLTANGGKKGGNDSGTAGAGGTASGGTTNTTGNSGVKSSSGSQAGAGGAGANGGAGGAAGSKSNGGNGTAPGGGGGGGQRSKGVLSGAKNGGSGACGQIQITYETLTLQVTRNLNYDGASTENFTILYYANYTNENLAAPTREGYVFLGWSLSQHGNDFVSTSDKCQNTGNYTIYAQWLNVGKIAGGSTTISPNDSYTINSDTDASTTVSSGVSYSWKCSTNGGAAAIVAGATSPSLTQQYNTQGTFAFTRYVTVNGQTYPSNGQMNITVVTPFDAGAIEAGNVTIIPGGVVSVGSVSVGEGSEWHWKVNGEVIDGESGSTLSNYQICTPNVYTFTRETKSPYNDWRASSGMYVATVSAINPGAINTEILDVTMSESVQIQNESAASIEGGTISSYEWTYTYNGGSETVIDGQTAANLELIPGSLKGAGQYVFKRYAKIVSSCEDGSVKRVAASTTKTVNVLITVHLHANGGSVEPSSFTVKYNTAYGSNINNIVPTHPSYSFVGWFTDAEMGTQIASSTICTSTSDETLYAHWGNVTPEVKECAESADWTLPAGVWKLTYIQAWGGGGSGGNATASANSHGAGSGGGGGAYSANTNDFSVIPGEMVKIAVGKGGNAGSDGGTSTVSKSSTTFVSAAGGKAGVNQNGEGSPAGGQGGAAGSFGDVNFAGGQGGVATVTNPILGFGGTYESGGGGGAAGTTGNGYNANKTTAGPAKQEGGGAGGAGFEDSKDGNPGMPYGGGGGGASRNCWSFGTNNGGSGADGHVTIAYEILTLQVTRNLNYDGAFDGSFPILYNDNFSTDILAQPTRSGYTFLGWTADKNGHNYLSTSDKYAKTSNDTIFAQWLFTGSISGTTSITSCANFGIENQIQASATNGVPFTYKWYLYKSGVTAPIASYDATPEIPTLESGVFAQSTANPGNYSVKRVVKIGNAEPESAGEYTVEVTYDAGNIENVSTTIVPGAPVSITGSELSAGNDYFWIHNGELVSGAIDHNLYIDANVLCSGTHTYQRYAKVSGCSMDSIASENVYAITVANVNPGKIADTTIYTCLNGSYSVENVMEASITPAATITYKWTYAKDGGAETDIANSDTINMDNGIFNITEGGTYVLKRYAAVNCSGWVVSEDSAIIHAVALPDGYDAPTPNYTAFCVGGKVIVNPSDNWKLNNESLDDYVSPTVCNWMVSMNGGPAQSASDKDTLKQDLLYGNATAYAIHAELTYFSQSACKVSTGEVTVMAYSDPTLGKPSLSSEGTCPNGEVTLTAGNITGGVASGEGTAYTYTWEFMGGDQTEWDTISANEATYDTYHNNVIKASNFLTTGDIKYRTYISNDRGCDAYSSDTVLHVIEVPVPRVRGDTTVCPKAGEYIAFKATTTVPNSSLRWYENSTTTEYSEATPTVSMTNELETTMYVAQFDSSNNCVSARLPDAIYITYSAHLQYVDAFGALEQEVCQNDSIKDIQFNHGGDCDPTITFNPEMPEGITIDNSDPHETHITGAPKVAGTYTYNVALVPSDTTLCASPVQYNGTIVVNPVYNVTDVQSLCAGASYIVSDSWHHADTFYNSGVYEVNLLSVNGCDSIVHLDLYVQEWNQFGYEENETLIAGWTSFSNVSSPIAADVAGSMPNSTISYDGWNGSNRSDDNLASTSSLVPTSGKSLGLINGTYSSCTKHLNNGKNIIIKTSTKDYSNIKLKLDYGIERLSNNDHGFAKFEFAFSTDNVNYTNIGQAKLIELSGDRKDGSFEFNLSSEFSDTVENQENLYIKIVFDNAAKSAVGFPICQSSFTEYSLLDNICISGTKAVDEITITGESEVCTNQGITLVATAPYENTTVEPSVTTPVNYNWERIVDGESTPLEGHDYIITDDGNIPEGNYQYVVSVGEGECILSDTLPVVGIRPAYRLDIIRNGYVCSNEVDQVANIIFTDECEYVPGMFIVTPSVEELREVGSHECQLSIPSETNPCDSVITLMLDVRKAFDTTVVAYLCLGESYTDFGFDFTPTKEGVEYLISPEEWKCSTGCDSIYRVTVITNSVQQILSSESDVILAAWNMNTGINNFMPTCGVRTSDAKFSVHNTSEFTNVSGHAPTDDYCYTDGGSNGALQWANLSSICSGFTVDPTFTYYNGVYFEIKLNPENYNNLRLKFDYKRENNNGGSAFNNVNYAYKFAADDEYTTLGSEFIEGTDWSVAEFALSSIESLKEKGLYLKLEFTGGSEGNSQKCDGLFSGRKYVPSYITIDNLMIMADRPALTTLDGNKQTCSATYVCEGSDVTFTCQGDDDYLKFYLVNENTSAVTAFDGNTELTVYPDTTTTYTIKAVDQITYCDSTWTFDVEVVKQPIITYVRGSLDHGICGDVQIDNEIRIENAASYSFTWLTEGNVAPAGLIFNDNGEGTITMGGTLTDVPSARYAVKALADNRCPVAPLQKTGVITVRKQPKWNITLGADTVCEGTEMQFQIDTNGLNFVLVPEDQRVLWSTVDGPIASSTDTSIYTLDYVADEATHSKMHYLTVNQNGCTTLDSVNIVVYDLASDNLSCTHATYIMNYGDHFLHADSLIAPPLMHNGDTVPANMIDTVLYRRTEAEEWHQPTDSVFAPSIDNLNTIVYWQVTDICGHVHECSQNIALVLPPCGDDHTVTDVDGNVYGTVRIGFNCWMKENLRTTHYADGTNVPDFRAYQGNDAYPDSAQNAQLFGLLYSWNATVNNTVAENAGEMVQGVCPNGWVVPNAAQFEKMMSIDVKELRTAEYWMLHDGTNTTGFTMLPAGYYNKVNDRCEYLLGNTFFWTSDLSTDSEVRTFEADCHCYRWQEVHNTKSAGLSVRCVQVEEVPVVEDISE